MGLVFVTPAMAQDGPPSGSLGSLVSVSCTSINACTAVGVLSPQVVVEPPNEGAVERWDGRRWRPQEGAAPRGSYSIGLSAVTCSSATSFTAVGSSSAAFDLFEHWNGASWTAQSPRSLDADQLVGISCTSPLYCIAVGDAVSRAGFQQGVIARWNGRSWANQALLGPPKSLTQLNDVSCPSPVACTTVGWTSTVALVEQWNGKAWVRVRVPAANIGLSSISCPTTTSCTAVGSIDVGGSGPERALAGTWDGGAWVFRTVAEGPKSQLAAVSCSAPGACVAVGELGKRPLVEILAGGTWSIRSLGAHVGGDLYSISCASRTVCTAVGKTSDGALWAGQLGANGRWVQTLPPI
jgi:hypothetical protein